MSMTEIRSGPLPDPRTLHEYDQIVPGMAERLLQKFEQQADHRMQLEAEVIRADIRRAGRGMIVGGVMAICGLFSGTGMVLLGHEGIGVSAIVTEFVSFAGLFVYQDQTRRKERDRKMR